MFASQTCTSVCSAAEAGGLFEGGGGQRQATALPQAVLQHRLQLSAQTDDPAETTAALKSAPPSRRRREPYSPQGRDLHPVILKDAASPAVRVRRDLLPPPEADLALRGDEERKEQWGL